jgi:Right handed beta helix region
VVYRTSADGITVMSNSWSGRILCNVVRESGDDMISVLNFGLGEPNRVGSILIEGNDLSGNYWGRGVAVHGGRDVTIRGNSIDRTTHGAGILIRGGPDTYKMANIRNVLVEGNTITEVQTTDPVYNLVSNWKHTQQAAIDIRGYGEVSDVLIKHNVIRNARYDGILVKGNVKRLSLEGNQLSKVARYPIIIEADPADISCVQNTHDSQSVNATCKRVPLPAVTGAGNRRANP